MSPGALDARVVRRHLAAIHGTVRQLRRHQGTSVEQLEGSASELWAVERGMQLCAQNALDVATHVAASQGTDVPDYASAIDALYPLGILPRDFATRFRAVAGFRNVLVHGYLSVDVALVHQILHERLSDFTEFAEHVERWLAEQPQS